MSSNQTSKRALQKRTGLARYRAATPFLATQPRWWRARSPAVDARSARQAVQRDVCVLELPLPSHGAGAVGDDDGADAERSAERLVVEQGVGANNSTGKVAAAGERRSSGSPRGPEERGEHVVHVVPTRERERQTEHIIAA